jgi:hypothetical protein
MSEPAGSWRAQFPGNLAWSNAALVTQGMAPYDAVALGEIDTVCARLRAGPVTPEAWRDEWVAMGERIEAQGDGAARLGHAAERVRAAHPGRVRHRRPPRSRSPPAGRRRPRARAAR